MLVFVVIVLAAGCLLGGLLAGQVALIWGALGLSLAGAALLAFVLVRGRRQGSGGVGEVKDLAVGDRPVAEAVTSLSEDDHPAAEVERPPAEDVGPPAVDEVAPADHGDLAAVVEPVAEAVESPAEDEEPVEAPGGDAAESVAESGQSPVGGDGERIVRVVPGRRRFHAEDCRLLAGHVAEEISLGEAREEGFSACTACIPRVEGLTSRAPAGSPVL
jgi:hypothetical protein